MLLPLKDDNPIRCTPFLTVGLIAINTVVMVWMSTLPIDGQRELVAEHGFVPARIAQFEDPKLVVKVEFDVEPPTRPRAVVINGRPAVKTIDLEAVPSQILASLVTTMFLHGGWLHLLGNMWFLWIFGNNIEDRLGHIVFLLLYLVGGLLATACHWAYDPRSAIPVIGASGAVAVILGAYAVTYPAAKVRTLVFLGILTIIDIPALVWLGLWFGGQMLTALVFRNDVAVAVWAHIGGFVAGAVLMPILSLGSSPPGSNWEEEIRKHFSEGFGTRG